MRLLAPLLICVLFVGKISGQITDLAAIYDRSDESHSYLLFDQNESSYKVFDAFRARTSDLALSHPRLTLSGDFTGDGVHELAVLSDLEYEPNMNPNFTCSVVSVSRSNGKQFIPSGSWFLTLKTQLNFDYVSFSVAGDYNGDGLCDIAILYNDPALDELTIYVLESTGSDFSEAHVWYIVDRNEFNFTALKFACSGDFDGNGKPDIAVFYNYFGTVPETKQSVFLFESEGNAFTLLPVAYDATKASYDFSALKFAFPGDYNMDGYSDVAVLSEDPLDQDLIISVFEGSAAGQLSPSDYNTFVDSGPYLSYVLHAAGGNFSGDTATDLALFYDNPGTGNQEILLLESDLSTFKAPELAYNVDPGTLSMASITSLRSGFFINQPVVTAATWKDDMQGAISFTFDDGYRGAFEHGGEELEAAGLKGTFSIFTDTSTIYDGELASTSLVREYKDKGHEIASHTTNHSNLGFLTASGNVDSLTQVLSVSVELLNERFDQYTVTMAIPFGSYRYETLEYIAQHFYSARSSQFGFNLATPYDFFALRSWPILSTSQPAFVDNLLSKAETYGSYLPLMYHDMTDEPFDEDSLIYTYSRELFSETVQNALDRDLWIDTYERIYKYIRERNALKIFQLESGDMESQPGSFSFEADDGLVDSIFNVKLTLKISLPENWTEDTISVGPDNEFEYVVVQQDSTGRYIHYDWLPVSGVLINVDDIKLPGTGFQDRLSRPAEVKLVAAPNPFHHETLISLTESNHSEAYLLVRDIHGRIVRELRAPTGKTYRLSREGLSPGIYIVQLILSGESIASLKLMAL
jgi:peptidoglycan/xylan/chitin deacetylase (PgdA/CDA1 family)